MIFEENVGARLERQEEMLTCLKRVKTYIATYMKKQSLRDVKNFASSNNLINDQKISETKNDKKKVEKMMKKLKEFPNEFGLMICMLETGTYFILRYLELLCTNIFDFFAI